MPERLVCLLPVRNGGADLPGYFASVRRFCDAVVALDDGSTDDTRALLEAEPLVQVILANPRRVDYRGWDDAANRNRTLAAAAALEPTWIISLDADERIDEADGDELRAFLESDALPGCAYGFRHVPMRGQPGQFLPKYQWIYRLFAYEPGLRFPAQRLHFVPVPTAIPRERWVRTTIRVQHLGGMTAERRLVRFSKYLEADPNRTYQGDYGHLLSGPDASELRMWTPRPADLPVLLPPGDADPDAINDAPTGVVAVGAIALSAIVIARHDPGTIARTVESVVGQVVAEAFETIVVVSGSAETAAIVRRDFPDVTLVEIPEPQLPGAARNAGLERAKGRYVSFPGSHVELPPGSLAARLAAHERGYAMVTGVTRNGNPTRAGWASYFLDHHAGLPGHARSELNGPPAHCSYARGPLLEVGAFPGDVRTGEDTAVNRALVRRGYVAVREPAVEVSHRSPCRTVGKLVRHHFGRGRGWGRLLLADRRTTGPVLTAETWQARGIAHLTRRLGRIAEDVSRAEPELADRYAAVRPLVALGATAAWAGMWWEVLRPAHGKLGALLGHPVRTVLMGELDAGPDEALRVVRVDRAAALVQTIPLARTTTVVGDGGKTLTLGEALAAAFEGDTGGELARVRALMDRAIHLSLDGFVVGAGVTEGLGGVAGMVRLVIGMSRGSVRTSLSAIDLVLLCAELGRLEPIVVRQVAHDPRRRLGRSGRAGEGESEWMA